MHRHSRRHQSAPPIVLENALLARWTRDKTLFEQSATRFTDSALITSARTRMIAFLQGRQRWSYDQVLFKRYNANTPRQVAAAGTTRAARQRRTFTRMGFPVAHGSDGLRGSLLFGQRSIPADMASSPVISNTFAISLNASACARDCMIGGDQARMNAAVTRYTHDTRLLADGLYVEELPWIASTRAPLPLVRISVSH